MQLANTSNTLSIIVPTDEDIDQSPYDCPTFWIARELDAILAYDDPLSTADVVRVAPDGRFIGKPVAAFELAVNRYADAVLKSDPNPDKSDSARIEYRAQHVVTRLVVPEANRPGSSRLPTEGWDERTFVQGPVVLAIANGPFYAAVLVLRGGNTLHIQSLNFDSTSVQVTL